MQQISASALIWTPSATVENFPAKTTITTKDMMLVASLLYTTILLRLISASSNNECYDAWECQSQELTGFVLCYGYQSCQSSSITSNYYVPCSGYKSCMNSKIESKSSITCDGDYACSNAQLSSPGLPKFIELPIDSISWIRTVSKHSKSNKWVPFHYYQRNILKHE